MRVISSLLHVQMLLISNVTPAICLFVFNQLEMFYFSVSIIVLVVCLSVHVCRLSFTFCFSISVLIFLFVSFRITSHFLSRSSNQPSQASFCLSAALESAAAPVRVGAEEGHPQVEIRWHRTLSGRSQLRTEIATSQIHPLVGEQSEKIYDRFEHRM